MHERPIDEAGSRARPERRPRAGATVTPATLPGVHAHVGIVTSDLDRAAALLSQQFGLQFPAATDGTAAPPFADGLGRPLPGLVRSTTSAGAPLRVELLEGRPGSVWHTTELTRLHHIAYWVDDVTHAADDLVAAGWQVEVTLAAPDARPRGFAYLTRPGDARIELTTRRA